MVIFLLHNSFWGFCPFFTCMMNYSINRVHLAYQPVFSILIPTWNNLEYLKFVISSLRKNSRYRHQILVHINEGKDGTEEWLVGQEDIGFTKSSENSGVCYGLNVVSHLAISDYLVLMDDDLYVCPDWDVPLLNEIHQLKDEKWCLSSTMIEPLGKNNPSVIANKNFGRHPKDFDEPRFLKQYTSFHKKDWNGSSWYPLVLPTFVFRAIGGLSVEFSPGMYSDPDFMIKLWHYGVRYFKGISASRAYHFVSVTTSRVKKNDGRSTFISKWGLSSNTFFRHYLKMGTDFEGPLSDPDEDFKLITKKRIDRWKIKLKSRFVNLNRHS